MDINIYNVAIVPLIMAMVQLCKQAGVPSRILPPISVALGIIAGIVYIAPDDAAKGVLLGLGVGLSAMGLFSGTKSAVGK